MEPDDAMLALTLRSTECHCTVPFAVVFHTFKEVESQVISDMSGILPPIYAIGPLPLLLKEVGASGDGDHAASASAASSLSKEDRACLDWLDGKRTDLRVNAINVTDPHVLAGVQSVSTNAQDTIGRNGTVIAGAAPAYYVSSGAAVMATISRAF